MCARVLLASARPLPLVAWDAQRPAFHVRGTREDDPVRGRFSYAHVYELGSHTGCACGLTLWPEMDVERSRIDIAALHAYLRSALKESPLEIFTCWYGEEGDGPVPEVVLPPEEIDGRNLGVLFSPQFIKVRQA